MSSNTEERIGFVVRAICAVGFFAAGMWGAVTVGGDALFWLRMQHAVQTPGRLITVMDGGNESVVPAVTYRYDFQGHAFTGNRVVVQRDAYNIQDSPKRDFPWALRRRLADSFANNEAVTVYVNADVPALSTLDRSFQFDAALGPLLVFLMGIPAGLGCAYIVYRQMMARNKTERKEGSEPANSRDALQRA